MCILDTGSTNAVSVAQLHPGTFSCMLTDTICQLHSKYYLHLGEMQWLFNFSRHRSLHIAQDKVKHNVYLLLQVDGGPMNKRIYFDGDFIMVREVSADRIYVYRHRVRLCDLAVSLRLQGDPSPINQDMLDHLQHSNIAPSVELININANDYFKPSITTCHAISKLGMSCFNIMNIGLWAYYWGVWHESEKLFLKTRFWKVSARSRRTRQVPCFASCPGLILSIHYTHSALTANVRRLDWLCCSYERQPWRLTACV